jgi:hypothetical protein
MVTTTEDIAHSTTFEITLVGIRNTEGTESLTFPVLLMDATNSSRVSQYYYATKTMGPTPAAFIDLLNVTIDYTDNSNALSNRDNYEFWFTVFSSGTSA